jgi:hypothetical protein
MHFATGLVGFLLQYSVIISSLPISNDTDPYAIRSQYFISAPSRLPEFVCLMVWILLARRKSQRTLISSKSVSQGCGLHNAIC